MSCQLCFKISFLFPTKVSAINKATFVTHAKGLQITQTIEGQQVTQGIQTSKEPQTSIQVTHTIKHPSTEHAQLIQLTTRSPQTSQEIPTSQILRTTKTVSTKPQTSIQVTHAIKHPSTEHVQLIQLTTRKPQTSQEIPTSQIIRTTKTVSTKPQTSIQVTHAIKHPSTEHAQLIQLTTRIPQTSREIPPSQTLRTTKTVSTTQGNQPLSTIFATTEPMMNTLQVEQPRTCHDVKSHISGWFFIDPDGDGGEAPFEVYCNMVEKGGVGVTVISHDTENTTHVTGCDPPGCYSRDVHYKGANPTQLAALANLSSHCEQFIRYDCRKSILLFRGRAWWVSRQGIRMDYWGGSDKPGKCGCAILGSCDQPNINCNCNLNDDVWRDDSGLLTDKNFLPVSQLRFGDVAGGQEEGYHTLGKLKCY